MTIIVDLTNTTPVETLHREVTLYTPGAPIFEVDYQLRQAVRDFCRITQVWQQRNTEILTTVADQEEYDADLPVGTELVAIISAWNGTTEIEVEVPGESDDQDPTDSSTTWRVGLVGTDTIRVVPLPEEADIVVTGTVAFAPNEESEVLPTAVYQRWRTPIVNGAIAKLMLQVGKPWSNPNQAGIHQGIFDAGAAECAAKTAPRQRRPILRVKSWG